MNVGLKDMKKVDRNIIESKTFYLMLKRSLDIIISVLALPWVILIVIISGVLIKIDTKGPIIYTQNRLGLNGKEFRIYKLRSMVTDAEEDTGAVWAEKDDPRVTSVGRVLRKHRIDELPQFFNILIGDMSLIGPRPERSDLSEKFEKITPGFRERLLVKPGITGWAQVNGGYEIKHDLKLKYDLEYIHLMSLSLDFKIIIKTVRVIFFGHGAR